MANFFKEYHELLHNCNKPYQYVGGEFLSENKSFDDAKVRVAFCFPDKYEIGISNLGVRILYGRVNRCDDYMADRVYAPEADFKDALTKQGKLLYTLEAKKPVKDFDVVSMSLQYELAYPTFLKMLEMSGIAIKSEDRKDGESIVIAGGPCTYNPLPVADFIDVFVIGDGEDVLVEICDVVKDAKAQNLSRKQTLENLAKLEGLYVPQIHTHGEKIKKRIVQIDYDNAQKTYPIPFSSSVHDRATIEIRRGCGRMCRFCQPGHVTLPVRERSAEDIIKISKELVQNTGYDEYSLLSLSSNDYENIKDVIKELAVDFDKKKVSVSLPSQRIDGFNLELAQLTQRVRKSTITLAPEAGSQRLRDVVRKNITREQIIDVALTLYENGWSKFKFYFIIGLPTETYEDIDEMAKLLEEIRYKSRYIKKIKGLSHSLDIVCTLSIFVPKPFTPFQWVGQVDVEEIGQRISYLREKTKHIKGVRINYHESPVSRIEAVLTRGDRSLCKYIEALYKKGCYLDAWGEYFNEEIWNETAEEMGISLSKLAQKEYSTDENLPWEIIETGLDKSWLISEYNDALNSKTNPSCQTGCVNCGVCKNLKTQKVMAKRYITDAKIEPVEKDEHPKNIINFKYRIKHTKYGILRYFSHLDWQNTFLKALARTGLPIAFSQGFNPTMKTSLGVALPLFLESDCEMADIELTEQMDAQEVKLKLESVVPEGCKILEVKQIERSAKAIDNIACWAEYRVRIFDDALHNFDDLLYNVDKVLSSDEILMTKKNKKGLLKTTNVKQSIKSFEFKDESLFIVLKSGQGSEIPSVRVDDLMKIIVPDMLLDIKRTRFFDVDGNVI